MKCYICPVSRLPILDGDSCIVVWLQFVEYLDKSQNRLQFAPIPYNEAVFDDGDLRGVEPEQPFMVLHVQFFRNMCVFMSGFGKRHATQSGGYQTYLLNDYSHQILMKETDRLKQEKLKNGYGIDWFSSNLRNIEIPEWLQHLYHLDAIMGNVGIQPTQSYIGSYEWVQNLKNVINQSCD